MIFLAFVNLCQAVDKAYTPYFSQWERVPLIQYWDFYTADVITGIGVQDYKLSEGIFSFQKRCVWITSLARIYEHLIKLSTREPVS